MKHRKYSRQRSWAKWGGVVLMLELCLGYGGRAQAAMTPHDHAALAELSRPMAERWISSLGLKVKGLVRCSFEVEGNDNPSTRCFAVVYQEDLPTTNPNYGMLLRLRCLPKEETCELLP